MNLFKKHIDLLGFRVEDRVTGLVGVITSVTFDLYGCIQGLVTPPAENSKREESWWCDVSRLKVLSDQPVMDQPNFEEGYTAEGKQGAAEKPIKYGKLRPKLVVQEAEDDQHELHPYFDWEDEKAAMKWRLQQARRK